MIILRKTAVLVILTIICDKLCAIVCCPQAEGAIICICIVICIYISVSVFYFVFPAVFIGVGLNLTNVITFWFYIC